MKHSTGKQEKNIKSFIIKIISGGQTGADRGGLDAAISLNIPHGGYCPHGRLAEDGCIPSKYQLTELKSKTYLARTRKNVLYSSATVIFSPGKPIGGSQKTLEFAKKYKKPYLLLDTNLSNNELSKKFISWIQSLRNSQLVLNVAGSRESEAPGIYKKVFSILKKSIQKINQPQKAI